MAKKFRSINLKRDDDFNFGKKRVKVVGESKEHRRDFIVCPLCRGTDDDCDVCGGDGKILRMKR